MLFLAHTYCGLGGCGGPRRGSVFRVGLAPHSPLVLFSITLVS